jgi:hypothetical protein
MTPPIRPRIYIEITNIPLLSVLKTALPKIERDRIAIGSSIKNKRPFITFRGSSVFTMGSFNIAQIAIMATQKSGSHMTYYLLYE